MECRHCGSTRLRKKGMRNNLRRYYCNDCKKYFTEKNPASNQDGQINYNEKPDELICSGYAPDLEDFLKRSKIDLEKWEIKQVLVSEWPTSSKQREQDLTWTISKDEKGYDQQLMEGHATRGDWQKTLNKSFKVILVPNSNYFDKEKLKREFLEDLKIHSVKVPKYSYPKLKEKHLLEINIFDLHLGKLGWHEETGSMSYDSKIAQKRFMEGIVGLVEKAKGYPIERILFPVGNDFFDSDYDYPIPVTTRGTPRQTDLRWQQNFRIGRKLIMEAINYLATIAPVDIVVVPGNHDFQKIFYLGDLLETVYANNSNITVNNAPIAHKYYLYGKNLIGFTHGNTKDIPLARLTTLMPVAVPELWAKAKFREFHLGDIHHKKVWKLKSENDEGGINIRYMRSLSGDDAWHAQKGYCGAIKGCEAYIWSEKLGMSAIINYNIIV